MQRDRYCGISGLREQWCAANTRTLSQDSINSIPHCWADWHESLSALFVPVCRPANRAILCPLLPASPSYSAWLRFAVSCPSVELEPRETQPTCTVSVHSPAMIVAAQASSEGERLLGKQALDGKKALERINQHSGL